jgi:hypothetical protein
MKTRAVLLLITISAALTCVNCASIPNAPSAANSSSEPAVESPPGTSPSAVSKLPSGAVRSTWIRPASVPISPIRTGR